MYEGEVESLSSATSAGAGIRVVSGSRQGFAYAGALDEEVLSETLAEARDNAAFSSPEAWVGLPEPDGARPVGPRPLARRAGRAARRPGRSTPPWTSSERSAPATPGSGKWSRPTGATPAARRLWPAPSAYGAATVRRCATCPPSPWPGTGPRARSLTVTASAAPRPSSTPAQAAGDAVTRAVRLLGATKPRSAHLPVVFEPRVSAQLTSLLGSVLSGEMVLKGTSLFAERLGEEVAAAGVTLVDDPTQAEAWRAASFDDEGLACRRNTMIEAGVLRAYLYDSTSARRAGTVSTAERGAGGYKSAPGVGTRAVYLLPGELSPDEVTGASGGRPAGPIPERAPLGCEPGERRLLGGSRGLALPGRRAVLPR